MKFRASFGSPTLCYALFLCVFALGCAKKTIGVQTADVEGGMGTATSGPGAPAGAKAPNRSKKGTPKGTPSPLPVTGTPVGGMVDSEGAASPSPTPDASTPASGSTASPTPTPTSVAVNLTSLLAGGEADSGRIKLTLGLPATASETYEAIEIRRSAGGQAPADCASGVSHALLDRAGTSDFSGSTLVHESTGLERASVHSFRFCITPRAGRGSALSTQVLEGVRASGTLATIRSGTAVLPSATGLVDVDLSLLGGGIPYDPVVSGTTVDAFARHRALLLFTARAQGTAPRDVFVRGALRDSSADASTGDGILETLRFERHDAVAGEITISWQIIEFPSDLARGQQVRMVATQSVPTPAAPETFSLHRPAMDDLATDNTFSTTSFHKDGGALGTDDVYTLTPYDPGGDGIGGVQLERYTAGGTLRFYANLVENTRWRVQRGTVSLPSAVASVDVDFTTGGLQPFDKAKSFVRFSVRLGTSMNYANLAQLGLLSEIVDGDTLRFRRGATGPSDMTIAWELVTFNDDTKVYHGTNDVLAGEAVPAAPLEATVTGATSKARSVLLLNGPFEGRLGYGTENTLDFGGYSFQGTLLQDAGASAPVKVRLERNTATHAATVGWTVIEFPQ